MRNRKGYSLIEILITLVLLALIIAAIAPAFLSKIDEARGNTLLAQARMVEIAAQAVITEQLPYDVSIEDLELGLTGAITNHSYPKQIELSKRINELLAPEVVLTEKPTSTTAKAMIKVTDNKVIKTVYETIIGKKQYTVVIENGVSTITYVKVVKKKK